MKYEYDMVVIGLGPAGMAVSIMGSAMGLKVCGIEKRALGGECMNVGCIPSKALLRMGKIQSGIDTYAKGDIQSAFPTPFTDIANHLSFIDEKKTKSMFDKVDLVLAQGAASFVDSHTVQVGERKISAKRIYISTGTSPMIPPIKGIDTVEYLTNENIFSLTEIPKSMTIIGGGAIGTEMAQAFSRLGCKTQIVHMDAHLIPPGDEEPARYLEESFKKDGIDVYNSRLVQEVKKVGDKIIVETDKGEKLESETLLVAAGRRMDFSSLKLENAGVKYTKKGITVNKYLQTSKSNIYAPGDCNGHWLLSHAAMHQGMLALINSMMPWPMKKNFKNYQVPWTVFTEPQYSHVGMTEKELKKKGIKYEVIEERYENYGAAIAEGIGVGFVRVFASTWGRIYGATVVGEGSGEMINEWALAIQEKIRLHKIMFLQHSFPTMSFLNKRISETWMMNRMKSPFLKKMAQLFY